MKLEFLSASSQRQTHAASLGLNSSKLVAYGSHNLVVIYDALCPKRSCPLVALRGHQGKVQCVRWISRGDFGGDRFDCGIVSTSADGTARIWVHSNDENMYKTAQILTGHSESVLVAGVLGGSDRYPYDIIATGSCDGTVRIWMRDITKNGDFEFVQVISLNGKLPLDIAISILPHSSIPVMAVGVTDAKIRLFSLKAETREFIESCSLQGHNDWVRALEFTQQQEGVDQFLLLASGSQDKCVRIWKISTRKSFEESIEECMDSLNLDSSGDYQQLSTRSFLFSSPASAGRENLSFSVNLESVLVGHEGWIHSVKWHPAITQQSPDADSSHLVYPARLLTSSADKSIIIWSPDGESGIWTNDMHVGDMGGTAHGVFGALWSPCGQAIVGCGYYGDFFVWKKQNNSSNENSDDFHWKPFAGVTGHFSAVTDMSWDTSHSYIISLSTDQTTRIFAPWNREENGNKLCTWHEIARPQVHGYDLQTLCSISPIQFASGADGEKVIRVFDAPKVFIDTLENISQQKLSNLHVENMPLVASLPSLGLSNKAVDDMGKPETHAAQFEAFKEPPLPSSLHHFTLWPENDKLYGHGDSLYSLTVSKDGNTLVSSSVGRTGGRMEDTAIRIWKRNESGHFVRSQDPIIAHNLTVTDLKFSHDDRYLVSVGRDRMWTLYSRDENGDFCVIKACPKAHARIIWGVSWSHDNSMFCTGSRDKTVSFWDIHSDLQAPLTTIEFESAVTAVEFLSCAAVMDGKQTKMLAVGLENGNLIVYVSECGKEWKEFDSVVDDTAHAARINRLKWRVDNGKYQLASCSDDTTIRIHSF